MDPLSGTSNVKPKLRGVIHEIAFFVSLVTGPILFFISRAGTHVAVVIYSIAMSGLFGVSALYHRPDWKPAVRMWMRRLDHTMILVFIAATCTPIAVVIGTPLARTMLIVVWCGALLGALTRLVPLAVPKPVAVIPYLALGWMGLTLLPSTWVTAGPGPAVLLLLGGISYTLGAIAYARRSPNPKPAVFGYHEIFHAMVLAGAYFHYVAVAVTIS